MAAIYLVMGGERAARKKAGMSQRPTLVRGGRVIDPDSGHDGVADVLIGPDGRIVAAARGLDAPEGAEVIEAKGLAVFPGFTISTSSSVSLASSTRRPLRRDVLRRWLEASRRWPVWRTPGP